MTLPPMATGDADAGRGARGRPRGRAAAAVAGPREPAEVPALHGDVRRTRGRPGRVLAQGHRQPGDRPAVGQCAEVRPRCSFIVTMSRRRDPRRANRARRSRCRRPGTARRRCRTARTRTWRAPRPRTASPCPRTTRPRPSGAAGVRSHRRFAWPFVHSMPDPRTCSAPLLLMRRCGRTLGTARPPRPGTLTHSTHWARAISPAPGCRRCSSSRSIPPHFPSGFSLSLLSCPPSGGVAADRGRPAAGRGGRGRVLPQGRGPGARRRPGRAGLLPPLR